MKAKKIGQLDHRERKNPRSRQKYREDKHKQNAERMKQIYDPETKTWIRRKMLDEIVEVWGM